MRNVWARGPRNEHERVLVVSVVAQRQLFEEVGLDLLADISAVSLENGGIGSHHVHAFRDGAEFQGEIDTHIAVGVQPDAVANAFLKTLVLGFHAVRSRIE